VKLVGSVNVDAKAASAVRVESGAQTRIKGATVKLQGNTQVNGTPVSTAGKLVMGTCHPTGGPLIRGRVMP
jgi:urease beta subunit